MPVTTHPARPIRRPRLLQDRPPLDQSIVGASPKMQRIFRLVSKVARTDSTVLLIGESGTGKELVARSIHLQSRRSQGPFVPVNVGALPESLIESELFGSVRGAFTGASGDRAGLVEEADGGTLFLDEIGDMPIQTQVKLLRTLENNEVRRLGDNATRRGSCRRSSGPGILKTFRRPFPCPRLRPLPPRPPRATRAPRGRWRKWNASTSSGCWRSTGATPRAPRASSGSRGPRCGASCASTASSARASEAARALAAALLRRLVHDPFRGPDRRAWPARWS